MRRVLRPVAVAVGLSLAGVGGQAQDTDERIVQIDTLNVRDTLYHLSGGGGNSLALIDEVNGGVILVDTKRPGWGAAVTDVVAQVTDLPVTTIINTHAHPDHAGSNGEFATVQQVIAHERTLAHLQQPAPDGADPAGLPTVTFSDRYSLLDGLDRIELYYFGPAHTDGDTVVVFPEKGVAYLGDLFPAKATPVIDRARGGSAVEFPETLARAVAGIEGVSRVITGHGPFPTTYAGRGRRERGADRAWTGWMTWEDLAEYADFTRAFLDEVTIAFEAGLSADEAANTLRLPPRYADYDMQRARATIDVIYRELAAR